MKTSVSIPRRPLLALTLHTIDRLVDLHTHLPLLMHFIFSASPVWKGNRSFFWNSRQIRIAFYRSMAQYRSVLRSTFLLKRINLCKHDLALLEGVHVSKYSYTLS